MQYCNVYCSDVVLRVIYFVSVARIFTNLSNIPFFVYFPSTTLKRHNTLSFSVNKIKYSIRVLFTDCSSEI